MGGSGAKNKRKQQRQMEGGEPPAAGPTPARRGSGPTKSTNKRPPSGHRRDDHSPPKKGDHSRQKDVRRNDNNAGPPPQKKKKFQKPKHLKRKLDSVDDEAKKAEILRQMETLEQKKRQKVKPPKTTGSKLLQGTGDRQFSEKQEVEEDFARSPNATKGTESSEQQNMVLDRGVEHHDDARRTKSTTTVVEEKPRRRRGRQDSSKAGGEDTSVPKEGKREEENNSKIEESSPREAKPEKGEEPKKTAAAVLASVITENSATMEREDSDGGGDSDSETDTDSSVEADAPQRQRGKKRRGRRDTSRIVEESVPELKDVADDETSPTQPPPKNRAVRRCIGRKPVTDFQVGQSYPGAVVYVKPFGVFLDIGCHSDAFCHVSRLRDDFVESPEALFQPGDPVEARVLEIDRRKKRITVSMQSEERIEDERASMEARQSRREKHKGKTKPSKEFIRPEETSKFAQTTNPNLPAARNEQEQVPFELQPERTNSPNKEVVAKPEAEMTPAELKRARKLARRAARREQQQQER